MNLLPPFWFLATPTSVASLDASPRGPALAVPEEQLSLANFRREGELKQLLPVTWADYASGVTSPPGLRSGRSHGCNAFSGQPLAGPLDLRHFRG